MKTLLTEAMRTTFDADYPVEDFRSLRVGIEFPVERQDYPGIWVGFTPTQQLSIVGVGHREYAPDSEPGNSRGYTRWRFAGYAAYTCVALSSLERDRLVDEVIRVMAFGRENAQTAEFRSYIESNEFLATNFDFDEVQLQNLTETPGTPWGTEEMLYEGTVSMECVGEFVSDALTTTLVPLSAIDVYSYSDREPDPLPADGWQ